ncbi:hypothetical protein EZV62_025020 [Acer yangbiense]|uniref:Uncharacterized protein n=1 Tax=Acer yangbiense TaxID=1000413 RepID=A0A5C7GXE1_9ROSI|nr:hypothetical protein EZV62_025020 [Acer yangbiense]
MVSACFIGEEFSETNQIQIVQISSEIDWNEQFVTAADPQLQKQQRASEASIEEQQRFVGVTSLISSSVDEITGRGCLSLDVIEQVENEIKMLKSWIS